jgi:hypothetical protein
MEKTVKTFKYALPDAYTSSISSNKLEGTWTYKGPRYLNVEFSKTGKVLSAVPLTSWEDYEDQAMNDGNPHNNLMLDCEDSSNALMATIFYGNRDSDLGDSNTFPHLSQALPNGMVYKRPNPTAPDHTYDKNQITFNMETRTWQQPFPWFKPWTNWKNVDVAIAGERQLYTETKASDAWADMSADIQSEWDDWDSNTGSVSAKMKALNLPAYMYTPNPWPGQPSGIVPNVNPYPANDSAEPT